MLGLGLSLTTGGVITPYYVVVANAFRDRVEADGGTVESMSCLKADLKVLNPIKPPAYTGLLNDYSGAAAAYSLRLLDSTYSGSAVRVRRASDNAEQDIAFANNELDTATLETFASGTDAFVTTIYDQSGNSNNLERSDASLQGKIVSSGSVILENGKPIIQRSASNDGGYFASGLNFVSDTNVYGFYYIGKAAGAKSCIIGSGPGSSDFVWVNDSSNTSPSTSSAVTLSNESLNGTSWTYSTRQDIFADISTQSLIAADIQFSFLGSGFALGYRQTGGPIGFGMAQFQELVLFDTTSNRTGIETNINDYYSIYP